jgi:nitrite reductase (NADH) small subunit
MRAEKTWVRITDVRNIPLREGRAVEVAGREIAIFNLGDGFLAVENRCPHKAGPLADGIVSGNVVVCPLHAWKFELETGEGVNAPSAGHCVETFRTRIEDGIVLVEVPSESPVKAEFSAACIEQSEMTSLTDAWGEP